MKPTKADMHVDKLLTNLLIGYRNKKYVWSDVAPIVNTNGRTSDKYATYPLADWFRKTAEVAAPSGPVPIGGFSVSTDSFTTSLYIQGTTLADEDVANANEIHKTRIRKNKARWCVDRIEMKMEADLADTIDTTGVWGTDNTTATDWDDYDNSTPVEDIETARDTIQLNTAEDPNVFLTNRKVWTKLKRNPEILDLLGANERSLATPELLASQFELEKIIIGSALYNSAKEGQTASMSRIWGDNALLLYVTNTPSEQDPTAVYTFQAQPLQIRSWREDGVNMRKSEVFEATINQGYKVVASDLGYFFSSIIS